MTETSSLLQDIKSVILKENEEPKNNIKNLQENLDERMDKIFDAQPKVLDKKLSVIMRQSHTPTGIEPPQSK